jgi:hypothetical protein
VAFQISPDALPTSAATTSGTRRNSEVLWRLRASASTPGLDYAVTFGVPVYAVAATTARTATPKTEAVAAKFRLPARPAAQRAADARIGFSRDTAGRVKFDFPAARNPKAATMITFFGLLFAGAAAGFLYADGGLFFPIVFGGVGALILLGASRMWLLGRSVIVNQGSVEIRWRMAGLGGSRAIAKESIQAVNYDTNTQVGSTPYYRVRLDVSGGNSVVVGAGLLQADAKWIAAETSAALGIESASA